MPPKNATETQSDMQGSSQQMQQISQHPLTSSKTYKKQTNARN